MQNRGRYFSCLRLAFLLTIVVLGFAVCGCDESGSHSPNPAPRPTPTVTPTIAPTPTQTATATTTIAPTATPTSTPSTSGGLWVPNLFGPSVNEFDPPARAVSGNPSPQFSNESPVLLLPAGLAFDSSQNLWVANCSDFIFGTGAIAEFTAAQLANLGNDSMPEPNTTLLDDGSLTILGCPWGAQFDGAGNLWITNRLIPDLVSYSPAQLAVGGALTPDTTITSTSFDSPRGIAFDASANLWIVENQNQTILGYKAATLAAALGHSGPGKSRYYYLVGEFRRPARDCIRWKRGSLARRCDRQIARVCRCGLGHERHADTKSDNHRDPGANARWNRLEPRFS